MVILRVRRMHAIIYESQTNSGEVCHPRMPCKCQIPQHGPDQTRPDPTGQSPRPCRRLARTRRTLSPTRVSDKSLVVGPVQWNVDFVAHLFLRGVDVEDAVELERFLGARRQDLGVGREAKAALRATVVATAAEDADVAAQILQLHPRQPPHNGDDDRLKFT